MTHVGNWQRLLAALIIAIGVATIWFALAAWGASLIETWLRRADGSNHKSVSVAIDGTPLIRSGSIHGYQYYEDVSYHNLTGEPVDIEREEWLTGASLPSAIRTPNWFHWPIRWGQVAGITDGGRPPIAWYLIRNNRPHGRAYLVGYDEVLKMKVGYIGRNGFRRVLPPQDEWFDLGLHRLSHGQSVIACSGNISFGYRPYSSGVAADEMRLPPWLVFLIDGQRLLQIDLRQRTLETLYEASDMTSVGVLTEASGTASEETEPAARDIMIIRKPIHRVVLRTAGRLIVIDPPTGTSTEFVLPEAYQAENLHVFSLSENRLLLQRNPLPENGTYVTDFTWLETDGTIARHERVALMVYREPSERLVAWVYAAAAPMPAGWAVGSGIIAPLTMVPANSAANYREAFLQILTAAWPALIGVVVVGAVLAWWVSRLQAKYHRSATGAWCTFVFLFGVPGFIAYWLEHRSSATLEVCGGCGQIVPRDREACAACATPFPVPAPLGTEIFA